MEIKTTSQDRLLVPVEELNKLVEEAYNAKHPDKQIHVVGQPLTFGWGETPGFNFVLKP